MNLNLYTVVSYLSAVSVFIPLSVCILNIKALNLTLWALFVYLLISAVTELLSLGLIALDNTTYAVQHAFTLSECTLLSYMYYLEFKSRRVRRAVATTYTAFLLTAVILFFVIKEYNKQDHIISTFESCIIIAFSASFFYKLLLEMNIPKVEDYYFFWMNAAFLIYFCISFFLFLFDDYIETCDLTIASALWSVHLITNIAYHILLAIGIWKKKLK